MQVTINSVFSFLLVHHLSNALTCIWKLILLEALGRLDDAIPLLARRGQPLIYLGSSTPECKGEKQGGLEEGLPKGPEPANPMAGLLVTAASTQSPHV